MTEKQQIRELCADVAKIAAMLGVLGSVLESGAVKSGDTRLYMAAQDIRSKAYSLELDLRKRAA